MSRLLAGGGLFAGPRGLRGRGDGVDPSAELLASMPQPLIDRINEIVKQGG
ncbi:MAG: hypothetical protein ACYTG5_12915 [Planctomycetota bacterium]